MQVQCLLCNRIGHHTLLHSSPLSSQTTAANSQSSIVANPAPSQVSRPGVQNRLLQLSGSQAPASNMVNNAATASTAANCGVGEAPNQVNVSLVESSVGFCFRPIFAMKVGLPSGQSVMAYGLFDTGSNKTLVSKEFQQQYRVKTRKQFVSFMVQEQPLPAKGKLPKFLSSPWWIPTPAHLKWKLL